MSARLTAAIDVGGTSVVGALLDDTGTLLRIRRPTPGPPGFRDPGSATVRAVAASLAARAPRRVDRVGVGFCEYVAAGRLTSREVMAWDEQPADWLPEVFRRATVRVESDVRCGLLAELRLGAARGRGSAAYIAWGTGLSSALLVDGAVWAGARGRAIALGELTVAAPQGPVGLEAYASGAGLAARYEAETGTALTARELLGLVADPVAARIAATAGAALAEALAEVVHLLDPEVVILGGGLGCAERTAAHRAVRDRWAELGDPVELVVAQVGADGPLLGAALAAGWRP